MAGVICTLRFVSTSLEQAAAFGIDPRAARRVDVDRDLAAAGDVDVAAATRWPTVQCAALLGNRSGVEQVVRHRHLLREPEVLLTRASAPMAPRAQAWCWARPPPVVAGSIFKVPARMRHAVLGGAGGVADIADLSARAASATSLPAARKRADPRRSVVMASC